MTFIWPQALVALALVPLGILLARRIDQRRRRGVEALVGVPPATAPPHGPGIAERVPAGLVLAALVVLLVGLARPQASLALPRLEATVMLTMDVSGSMAADDLEPSRMEVAKATARAIVERQPAGVIIGVVAFSDSGLAVLEPTSERADVLAAIERLAPTRGTSLGQGVLAALTAIERSAAGPPPEGYGLSSRPSTTEAPAAAGSDAARAIVVISDGENTAAPDPLEAAREVGEAGIRIVALGVGSPEGADLEVEGFRIHSQLDEEMLRAMTERTAGSYHRVADPAAAVDAVYDELGRAVVVRSEQLEVTGLFAGAALVLFVLGGTWSLLRTGRLP